MKSILRKLTCFVATLIAVCGSAVGMTANTASADQALEGRYYDKPVVSTRATGEVETVNFASIDNIYTQTPNRVPLYYHGTLQNACGPIGGSIVVGYYDKYFQNLIPNYTNYSTATGNYRPQDSTYIPALIQEESAAMAFETENTPGIQNEMRSMISLPTKANFTPSAFKEMLFAV